ncbi:hypothetical protein VAE122_2960266 [Vibrio aestuarianus]|nr:hypothetical protein VAE122_2960266 [Vibrio aestuarianus]
MFFKSHLMDSTHQITGLGLPVNIDAKRKLKNCVFLSFAELWKYGELIIFSAYCFLYIQYNNLNSHY